MRTLMIRSKDQWALLPGESNNAHLAVFVHGYEGDYLSTWGQLPGMLAENADGDNVLRSWDFLFLGYDTREMETYLDIAALIGDACERASKGMRPYPRRYHGFALFGHSLGTLGIRQLLCAWSLQPQDFLKSLHSATLFGSPITGSIVAYLSSFDIGYSLRPNNAQLRMLREWTKSVHQSRPWPQVKVILGRRDRVVGHKSALWTDWQGDIRISRLPLGHSQLVKPGSWDDSPIVGFIESALE